MKKEAFPVSTGEELVEKTPTKPSADKSKTLKLLQNTPTKLNAGEIKSLKLLLENPKNTKAVKTFLSTQRGADFSGLSNIQTLLQKTHGQLSPENIKGIQTFVVKNPRKFPDADKALEYLWGIYCDGCHGWR